MVIYRLYYRSLGNIARHFINESRPQRITIYSTRDVTILRDIIVYILRVSYRESGTAMVLINKYTFHD